MLTLLRARAATLERGVVIALGLMLIAVFAFAELADVALETEAHALDTRVLLALREGGDLSDPWGPRWFEEMMRDFTALGGTGVLTLLTLAVSGFLKATGKGRAALMVIASIIGGLILSHSLKWGFDRPRPDLVPHGQRVYTQSFPSGHAMMSAVVYLTLGMLLARTRAAAGAKMVVLGFAIFVTLLVGASRVYLGVHWPTDVLAGWAGGAAWAIACWLVMTWLQRRGDVEPPTNGEGEPAAEPGDS
jgi:undecaprenyl-diphosphatase